MNFDKLFSTVKNKLFTDIILILVNKQKPDQIEIKVHKNILYSSCEYFEKLFTICKEKNSDMIEIEVPNVHIAYDIITSFYNQKTNSGNYPEWCYILQSYRTFDFFGLKFDKEQIYNLVVPEEGFELLLDTVELIGYNKKTVDLINKNLPKEYDLSKFPRELVGKMLKQAESFKLVSGSDDYSIKIWNAVNGRLLLNLTGHIGRVKSVCFSPDNTKIVSGSNDNTIRIWNAETGEQIRKGWHNSSVTCVRFSYDGRLIASISKETCIYIWDAIGNYITSFQDHGAFVNCLSFSHDSQTLASGSDDCSIIIWNTNMNIKSPSPQPRKILTIFNHHKILDVCHSPNGTYIVSTDKKGIKIWNAKTGNLIGKLFLICASKIYFPNDSSIYSLDNFKDIIRWSSFSEYINGNSSIVKDKIIDVGTSNINTISYYLKKNIIAIGGDDNIIKIWNCESKFSPDGKIIDEYKVSMVLDGHTGPVRAINFSNDKQNSELSSRLENAYFLHKIGE